MILKIKKQGCKNRFYLFKIQTVNPGYRKVNSKIKKQSLYIKSSKNYK
jgi:hypothetical protein